MTSLPFFQLFFRSIFGIAIPLLNQTQQLLTLAIDSCNVIVSEFTPLLLDISLQHLPLTSKCILIHTDRPLGLGVYEIHDVLIVKFVALRARRRPFHLQHNI